MQAWDGSDSRGKNFNLANDPGAVRVQVDHRRLKVHAESLTGVEPDEACRRIVSPGDGEA